MTDHHPALFDDVYPPGLIAFYLAHWQELRELSLGMSASDTAEYLRREWELIQSRRSDSFRPLAQRRKVCLCDEAHEWTATPRGGGGLGDAAGRTRRLLADLEQAADTLPVPWQATERVYRQQHRYSIPYRVRLWRYRQNVEVRDVDRQPEPEGSYRLCLRRMAEALGWSEQRRAA